MQGAFPALAAETHGRDTVLRGVLPDQSALYGVLAQIEALGLELLEARRLDTELSWRLNSPEAGDRDSPRWA